MSEPIIHIDGDFATGAPCKYHCAPTCHPCNIGPDPFFACKHPTWPDNMIQDFAPGVDCGGIWDKCELSESIKACENLDDAKFAEYAIRIFAMAEHRKQISGGMFKKVYTQIVNWIIKNKKGKK